MISDPCLTITIAAVSLEEAGLYPRLNLTQGLKAECLALVIRL